MTGGPVTRTEASKIVLRMRNVVCVLGHTQRAYECPACGEAFTPGQYAKLEHWRWYRGRTSSKRIKAAIDVLLDLRWGPAP